MGSIPGSGGSPGVGNGHPLQYSCLGNPTDRGAWWATVHGVAKSWMQLSDWGVTAYFCLAGSSCHSMSQLKRYRASIHSTGDYLPGAWGHRANLQSINNNNNNNKKNHFNFLKSPKIWKGTQSYWCVCWLEWLCGSVILIYNCIFVLVEITLQLNNGRWKGINLPTREYKTHSREQASIWG